MYFPLMIFFIFEFDDCNQKTKWIKKYEDSFYEYLLTVFSECNSYLPLKLKPNKTQICHVTVSVK